MLPRALFSALVIGASLIDASNTYAQRLPFSTYSTSDGLAHYIIYRIVPDSRGFLWFCTRQGLSRFDGREFLTFGTDQGLPSPTIYDFVETSGGSYWIGTAAGLVRFDPRGRPAGGRSQPQDSRPPMFTSYRPAGDASPPSVQSIAVDRHGELWVGTPVGLYRVHVDASGRMSSTPVDLKIPDRLQARSVGSLVVDRAGALWAAANAQLYRIAGNDRIEIFGESHGIPKGTILRIREDRDGRIWLATQAHGLRQLTLDGAERTPRVTRVIEARDGLASSWVSDLVQDRRGTFWAATTKGIARIGDDAGSPSAHIQVIAEAQGLPGPSAQAVAEDAHGNLWIGVDTIGAAKLSNRGFTTFDLGDRVSPTTLVQSRDGQLIVTVVSEDRWSAMRFDGRTFVPIEGAQLSGPPSWGWNQMAFQDHTGAWWFGSAGGLVRYSALTGLEALRSSRPDLHFTHRDGLSADVVIRTFEDTHGDIWIATVGHGLRPDGLSVWRRETRTLEHFSEADGLPNVGRFYPSSFAADRAGHVWIGFSGDAGLARYADGRFTRFTSAQGVPRRQIRNLTVDSSGRLWAASYGAGLCRVDDPSAASPTFRTYTTADGLSSNETLAVVEASNGDVYVGTAAGIDRWSASSGAMQSHYTTSDGLPPSGEMFSALRDRNGVMWFAYNNAVVQLVPEADRSISFEPMLISGIQVDGRDHPMSALGETDVKGLRIPSGARSVRIAFMTPWFGSPKDIKYEYQLDGRDRDWSPPTDLREVNFAGISTGTHRFSVRAVRASGGVGPFVATVTVTVVPPFWRAGWFLALVVVAIGGLGYAGHRWRTRRLVEMANMRTRIATDLHDDIGADLSRVAVLTEVVRRSSAGQIDGSDARLASIARIARDSVAGMSDIVWAINPERDRIIDLVRKMREYAEESTEAAGVRLTFEAPKSTAALRVGMDVRRDLYLIFKEALSNAIRHARCHHVRVTLSVHGRHIQLEVHDDGVGFDPAKPSEGNGIVNMTRRAERLGAGLSVRSSPNEGTSIRVSCELQSKERPRATQRGSSTGLARGR